MTFPKDQIYCVLDYETYSEIDLKKVGSYEYSMHPSTEIICAAWRIGTRETLRTAKTEAWANSLGAAFTFGDFFSAFMNKDIVLVAHNALFEQVITRNVFATKYMYSRKKELQAIPSSRWVCTASLAASLALPRNLEGAALALKLPVEKDMEGRKLMLKWCKPRKATKKSAAVRHDNPDELLRLIDYCKKDVDAEVELFLRTPPLTPTERKVWELDQKINLRGFLVDRPLVKHALKMIETETARLNKETEIGTMGIITSANQRDSMLEWLRTDGVFLPNLQKKTVDDAISTGLVTGTAKTLLQFRQAVSKTSTAKYQAFEQRSRCDGRLRDILVYHTASTGRWGGAGVQPQNFPRGSVKDTVLASEIIAMGDLELVRMLYGEPMEVLSSCLRGMIVAPPGKVLDVADYAAIEARVLFWVAKHEGGMQAFRDGRKMYEELATKIFGVPITSVSSKQRFVGKQATLGCGYSMGADKFQATCLALGQEISPELADTAVKAYREAHAPVVQLWNNFNRAAIAAVENPGKKYTINRVTWYVGGKFLWCVLPSGRRLAYYGPSVKWIETPWRGGKRLTLFHYGVDPLSRKWVESKTYGGKLTENVVQAISRDLMAEAMLRIEATGIWELVLSVHDELIAERLKDEGSNKEFCQLMADLPEWAAECPVKVEGWSGVRYKK